ncbi:GH25 family lysozyme [Falsirhodobacter sp. 20TX0035]|uniref:GH25 family lysozyme n=1 Tax=Falsirhodobacter sp. 20TX0035 TaxID=3022019 RepID=UPI00232DA1EE|nr:GH25 family lysozyme [Falsirhodobacter sp. 20TX0035]MDB6453841.1 GH25 family lysozyme [Falsirhodobacter sp. 20TX0035]
MRPVRLLALLILAVLAACGPREPMSVPGLPRQFGDAAPYAWRGRNVPAAYPVHGIDVARYQTNVDWGTARSYGVRFAFIKATEGGDYTDPMLNNHRSAARAAGIPSSAYHYYYFCRTPQEQAAWYIANVPRRAGDLPPVLDMEWTPTSRTCTRRPPAEEVRQDAAIFTSILTQYYGQRPIMYLTVDFFRDNEMWRVPGVEFWLRSVAGHPSEVHPGHDWTFWQYTGTGLIPGIDGRVDINAFRGSEPEWAVWLAQRTQR